MQRTLRATAIDNVPLRTQAEKVGRDPPGGRVTAAGPAVEHAAQQVLCVLQAVRIAEREEQAQEVDRFDDGRGGSVHRARERIAVHQLTEIRELAAPGGQGPVQVGPVERQEHDTGLQGQGVEVCRERGGEVHQVLDLAIDGGGIGLLLAPAVPGLGGEGDPQPLCIGVSLVGQGQVHHVGADREGLPGPHRVEPGRLGLDRGQSVQEPRRRQHVVRDFLVPAEGGDL
ncbi:hypothetical protein [Actinacidiphila paucisporea]|uniref:hypothetical protein n=1 Tax=Actinacidiphila paucisporea TaxID=310782 RepID=UPI0013566114|nr:hypothetical protein [Actinacidiphila paucisporea]